MEHDPTTEPNSFNGINTVNDAVSTSLDDMALAAAEAAAAVDGVCRICGKGDDGRQLCRFLPVEHDIHSAIMTWSEDITLHVFCGKTASILPHVNLPEYEILSKAGLKNKHGIGPEVNGALARTRSSIVQAEGAKEKYFFLVKEFESNLAAIRNAIQQPYHAVATVPINQYHHIPSHHTHHHLLDPYATHDYYASVSPLPPTLYSTNKPAVHRASSGGSVKYSSKDQWSLPPAEGTVTADGKIRCGCGGVHLPTGTPKGDASWRSHVMTKRHQKWMEDNGLLGAV
jgi:hypothetical protein